MGGLALLCPDADLGLALLARATWVVSGLGPLLPGGVWEWPDLLFFGLVAGREGIVVNNRKT